MKAAMWGVGLCVIGLLGLVLINLFGNITVTNQFNYTTMKNAVQAAMLDSLDVAHYRAGFCLCTTDGSTITVASTKVFSDKNEYEFRDIVNDKCVNADNVIMTNCVKLYGEYRLDPVKFEETFKERFTNVKTNDKAYDYVIKEVIEYPPKVSVRVVSKDDEFSPTDKESGGYEIINQIDAIIESSNKGEIVENNFEMLACFKKGEMLEWGLLSTHKTSDGWTILDVSAENCKVKEKEKDEEHCYIKVDGSNIKYEWGLASAYTQENGWHIQRGIKKENCKMTTITYTPTSPGSPSSNPSGPSTSTGNSGRVDCAGAFDGRPSPNANYMMVC